MTEKDKKFRDKEEGILRAAIKVFASQGYHRSSVADVAKEAGIAAGTIYIYFARKEELLIEMVNRYVGKHCRDLAVELAQQPAGMARLREMIRLHLEFFERDRDLARVFQIHARELHPLIRTGFRPTLLEYFGGIERVLREGMECGDFDPQLDVRLARRFVFGALDEVVTSWVLSEKVYSLAGLLDSLFRMTEGAVRVRPA
ncbi:MAG TPA: TetR/AcrR family transcriptional regulator [Planctomycetota bacterium]